jgi:hypothetical protein
VNSSPAMSMDNNIDYQIKPDLIKDIISILNFESYEQYQVKSHFIVIKSLGEIEEKNITDKTDWVK